eukprot:TRINITY_DN30793_c0_g1_i2.p1 TRINITY_DN30793_c0_g1~~TRINITY_DN30793_c0_g1_i2.p1  ORF type:complete len:226 (-),score=42.06 TRINITY_DN30793_c0_g1_i2:301-978(-)
MASVAAAAPVVKPADQEVAATVQEAGADANLPTLMTAPQSGEKAHEAEVVGASGTKEQDLEMGAKSTELQRSGNAGWLEDLDELGRVRVTVEVQEHHPCLRMLICSTALVMLVFAFMSLFNVFLLLRAPFHYMLMFYNIFCAATILVMDGKPMWFGKWWTVQMRLFRLVPCLAWLPGRAMFYFFVGSFTASFFGWSYVFAACGGMLDFIAMWTIILYCCCGVGRG